MKKQLSSALCTMMFSFLSLICFGSVATEKVTTINKNFNTTSTPHFNVPPVPSPWSNSDIGSVAASGSADYDSGSGRFTIEGSGADIWSSNDEFHYVYQPVTGDGEIIARVISLDYTHGWAKAGIMMRNSLASNSATALVSMHPNALGTGSGYTLQQRNTDGSTMTTSDSNIGPELSPYPVYLRLVRSGDTFTAYGSLTNGNWQLLGSRTVTMGQNIYVGLAVTSHDDGILATGVFEDVSLNFGSNQDTQAPTVATLISTEKSDTSVNLSWNGATDNVAITGYRIYQDGSAITTLGNVLNYQVSNLQAATPYNFTVTAFDAAGNEGAPSTILSVTTDGSSGPGSGSSTSVWSEANTTASYDGEVAVGTASVPLGYKMAIDGKLITEEVRVELSSSSGTWPDYVFSENYDLPSLEDIQKHVQEKGHLPNIPSAQEVEANGVELGEMNRLLLEKIEELTLHVIQLKKEINQLKNEK